MFVQWNTRVHVSSGEGRNWGIPVGLVNSPFEKRCGRFFGEWISAGFNRPLSFFYGAARHALVLFWGLVSMRMR